MGVEKQYKKNFPVSDIKKQFPDLITEVLGEGHRTFSQMSSFEQSWEDSICLVGNKKQLDEALKGKAQVFLIPPLLKESISDEKDRTFLVAPNHSLAHARILELLCGRYPAHAVSGGIHPSAIVSSSAELGEGAKIGPHVVIGEGVKIGRNVFVGANCIIENNSSIGDDSHLWPLVFIGADTQIGARVTIHPNTTIGSEGYGFAHDEKFNHYRIPQIGNVVIEDDVEIGSNVSIDRGGMGQTRIGRGSKLDNIIHIAHNVKIGKNCLLTSGFTIGGSSTVGDNVVAGGNVTIRDHISITDNVRLAGWSGVNNNIDQPGDYGGHPLQPVKDYLKTTMCLSHLPEFRKRLRELEAEVRKSKNV